MHSLYPSLGVRKWSKDHFEVMPVPEQNSQPKHKNTQNTQTKNRTKQPQNARKEHGMTAPISYGIQCQRIKRSCTSNKEENKPERQQSKIPRRCPANTSPSSAETQDPPCQDPGDRTEEPSGIRHLRNGGIHAVN